MNTFVDIREVQLEEVDGVLALFDEYERPQSVRSGQDMVHSTYAAIVRTGGCVVGAFFESRLVGTCTVNLCANLSWSCRPYAIIENVIVSRDFRKRGVGKAILEYAKTFSGRAGCYKVALMTGSKDPATLRFYESAGFSPTKQGYQVRFNA